MTRRSKFRRIAIAAAAASAALVAASVAQASQLIDRNASAIKLETTAKGEAMITYKAEGKLKHVLAWGAVNAHALRTNLFERVFQMVLHTVSVRLALPSCGTAHHRRSSQVFWDAQTSCRTGGLAREFPERHEPGRPARPARRQHYFSEQRFLPERAAGPVTPRPGAALGAEPGASAPAIHRGLANQGDCRAPGEK